MYEATLSTRPDCDVHKHDLGETVPAYYDGKTVMGPWAYMCESCFQRVGVGLGLGRGQRLVVRDEK
jgi:hypothetical protein